MMTLIGQECYKLLKKRSTLIVSGFLVLSQIVIAVLALKYPHFLGAQDAFMNDYFARVWIVFFLIASASSIIAMESEYGTLRALLYRRYADWQVLVSKWLTMLIYSVYLYGVSMIVALILKVSLFNQKFSLTAAAGSHRVIWQSWLLNNLSEFMTIWFLLSLVLLLATLFNNASPAIITGIVGYFVLAFVSGILFVIVQKFQWLKWNPLNMMNAGSQLVDGSMSKMTLLSLPEILIGYLVYMAIFFALGLVSFHRRSK